MFIEIIAKSLWSATRYFFRHKTSRNSFWEGTAPKIMFTSSFWLNEHVNRCSNVIGCRLSHFFTHWVDSNL